jgi:hypothetical protein
MFPKAIDETTTDSVFKLANTNKIKQTNKKLPIKGINLIGIVPP